MTKQLKAFAAGLGVVTLAGLGAFGLTFGTPGFAQKDRGFLAGLISQALSSPGMEVSVGAIDGALSSDATIRDVVIADKDGPWLTLDRARLVWTRTALLSRRLEVNRLEIGKLTITRKPVPSGSEQSASEVPLLPELPLKVEIERFALQELALGELLLGHAARLSAEGRAKLGPPTEGLDLTFATKRLDQPGNIDIKIGFVPKTQGLTVKIKAQEPQGGLIAHLAQLPELPPVALDIDGKGSLDAFVSRIIFTAGVGINADGNATLTRQGDARRLNLAMAARIEGLLPHAVAPIFAGATRLDGDLVFADSGAISAERFSIVARAARLDVAGSMAANENLKIATTIRAVPGNEGVVRTGDVEIKALDVRIDVGGTLQAPRVTGDVALADAHLPSGRFGRLAAKFSALPNGSLYEPTTRIALEADAEGADLAFANPAYAKAVGSSAKVSLRGWTTRDGEGEYDILRLTAPNFDFGFSGALGPKRIAGKIDLKVPDLSRFARLAGLELSGEGVLAAKVEGAPKEGHMAVMLDGRLARLTTGIDSLNGLMGGHVALTGTVKKLPAGGFGFEDLKLVGAHLTALVKGDATTTAAAIDARVDVTDLKRADPRLSGRASLRASLTGNVQKPDAAARLTIVDANGLGRPIPHLVLEAVAHDLTGALDARIALDGEVDKKPAKGALKAAKQVSGGWRLDDVDLGIGSVRVKGAAALDAAGLASGRVTLAAADLDDLSALALQKLAGRLEVDLVFDARDGRQGVAFDAKGSGIRAASVAIDRLDGKARIADASDRPIVDANIAIDRASLAGEVFSKIRLVAKGTPAGSDFALNADAQGFSLSGAGRLVPEPLRLDLAAFEAKRGKKRIALAGPASIAFADGGAEIRNLAILADGGRILVQGRAGATLALDLSIKGLPLSVAEVAQSGLGLSGTLDGEARITGPNTAPAGDWRLKLVRLVTPQTQSAGLPALDTALSGRLGSGRTTVSGNISAGKAGAIRLSGSLPLDLDGTLDLAAAGELDAGLANKTLAAGGQRLTGRLALDATLRGTAAAPLASGIATMSGGTFEDPLQGVRLGGIQARILAQGDEVLIERASATTRNGGTLAASGRVRLAPDAGFPGAIRIQGNRAQLVSNETMQAIADLSLELSGGLAERPRVNGRVDIVSLDVTVPERIPVTSQPLAGTKHVDATETATARLALDEKAKARAKRKPTFDADIELTIAAPNRIFVRGRGIDAELGGDIRLSGTIAQPVAIGAFEMRRGRLGVLSQRLDFTRGRLTFSGELSPELDFVAETRAGDVTAQIAVSGQASQPTFAFTSQPDLPSDEVLSRIMFQKASGGLSAMQALQLAATAAQFAGEGGNDAFETMRKALGVNSLDLQMRAGKPTVGASRYISDNVSVGVRSGATPEQSAVSIDIDVTRRLRVQGEVGADGRSTIGVGAEWEY